MALRGFSAFEKMFRAKMAQATPINVLTAKKKNDGLTQQETADYRRVFNKVTKIYDICRYFILKSEACNVLVGIRCQVGQYRYSII